MSSFIFPIVGLIVCVTAAADAETEINFLRPLSQMIEETQRRSPQDIAGTQAHFHRLALATRSHVLTFNNAAITSAYNAILVQATLTQLTQSQFSSLIPMRQLRELGIASAPERLIQPTNALDLMILNTTGPTYLALLEYLSATQSRPGQNIAVGEVNQLQFKALFLLMVADYSDQELLHASLAVKNNFQFQFIESAVHYYYVSITMLKDVMPLVGNQDQYNAIHSLMKRGNRRPDHFRRVIERFTPQSAQ